MSTSMFSTSKSITSLSSIGDSPQQLPSFSSFAPPPPSISPPPAVTEISPPSVPRPPVSLPPPPRHSLASSSSPLSSNMTNTTPTATITDDGPLLPPPTIKPSSSWTRARMLERQFDLVQQADELREVRDRQGWYSGTDERCGGGAGSRDASMDGVKDR